MRFFSTYFASLVFFLCLLLLNIGLPIGLSSNFGESQALRERALLGILSLKNNLNLPAGLAFDTKGDLWVADGGDSRVLQFAPPFANNMNASLVIGQGNFAASTCASSPTSSSLCSPTGLAADSQGNIWVADFGDSRVLQFSSPFSIGTAASVVIGQPGFDTNAALTVKNGVNHPTALSLDSQGNLWVADGGNNRVLEFAPPLGNSASSSLVIGQVSFAVPEFSSSSMWILSACILILLILRRHNVIVE